ncbi:ribonuclease P protein component [Candidatus Sumerlaeota bacterium]|nr:ribonuclease P protein component [Candidatus Sumerlaeota bacterium]
MSERFGRDRRLGRRNEFRQVYAEGKVYATDLFVCYARDTGNTAQPARLGLAASRQTGAAHDRNRYKRWAREQFRRQMVRAGTELVISFRPAMASATFDQFRSALLDVFRRARLLES